MATPRLLQETFRGFKQDYGKDQVPSGYVWDMLDLLPNIGVNLRGRGGWTYQGVALDTLNVNATPPRRVMYAPFVSTAGQVLAWDDTRLYDLTSGGGTDRGATSIPLHTPVIFRDLVIWGDDTGTAKKYDGAGAPTALLGTPPTTPRCSCVYRERLLFSGRSSVIAEYASVYFSGAGNAETWDLTNAVIQTSQPIIGLAPLRNALIVFHSGSVEIIRGTTPPSSTGVGDMTLGPLYDSLGLFEPNSFVTVDDSVVFADENGLYSTDGAALTDLTEKGGIKQYWQTMMNSISVTNLAVGAWRGFVTVSVQSASDYLDFLVCHVESRSWFRFSNIRANNFSQRPGADAFYFSNRQTKYVGNLAPSFIPAVSNKSDPSGIPRQTPTLTTPFYMFGGQGKKRARFAYVSYHLADAASDNPVLYVSFTKTPESESYAVLSPTLAETAERTRARVSLGRALPGFSLKLAIASSLGGGGISSNVRLYAIEADEYALEGSRR